MKTIAFYLSKLFVKNRENFLTSFEYYDRMSRSRDYHYRDCFEILGGLSIREENGYDNLRRTESLRLLKYAKRLDRVAPARQLQNA